MKLLVSTALLALALPLIAWHANAIGVQAVALSPDDVTGGAGATGRVTLDAPSPLKTFSATLTSANPQIAAVPSTISFAEGQASQSFPVRTAPGAAGCVAISARAGSAPAKSAVIAVRPPAPSGSVQLTVSPASGSPGTAFRGAIVVTGAPAGTSTVRLASSDAAFAQVPASVQVTSSVGAGGTSGSASFTIATPLTVTSGVVCPIITATHALGTSRALIKLAAESIGD